MSMSRQQQQNYPFMQKLNSKHASTLFRCKLTWRCTQNIKTCWRAHAQHKHKQKPWSATHIMYISASVHQGKHLSSLLLLLGRNWGSGKVGLFRWKCCSNSFLLVVKHSHKMIYRLPCWTLWCNNIKTYSLLFV